MLPYHTLQEAEVALGRRLTLPQTIWFKYSANKPDFLLHCHNSLFLLFFYSIAPIPFLLMELGGNHILNKHKIQPKVKRTFSEMFKCYKDVLHTFVIAVTPLQIISYPTIKWIGIRTGLSLPSGWELFWQILVYFVIEDYLGYWVHRMLHYKWAYQKIHKVHHEYSAPIGLSAPYAHWAEIIILGIPAFIGPVLLPGHITTYWLWFILRQIEAIETHSGYDFPWSCTKFIPFYGGAAFHDYHHYVGEKTQSNFASVFTYCDYIYGTHKGYQYIKQKGRENSTYTKKYKMK
ncbi:methylsterol monooxygenase 1-2-like [Vigna umbellata]|uniref:methylsterol monooxygenase 1-2-like n=1 Tax=Vigna umbellata TaxID=87088 RepID=UPI001F5F4103|nr:methylsterol monooxygenase 1-2-like [Vigna umbellata]